MSKFSPVAQVPRYLLEFQCIGPSCPETCCSGWRVTIDKPHYKLLKNITELPMKQLVDEHLVKSDGQDAASWGHLRMKPNGDCGFLESDRLCGLQKQLGEQALSDTCRHYPRAYQKLEDDHRVFATMSCPEAARLALSTPDAMAMESITLDQFANEGELPNGIKWQDKHAVPSVSFLAGRVMHDLLIVLMQDEARPAFDSLALGLMLIRRVNEFVQLLKDKPDEYASRDVMADHLSQIFQRFTDGEHLDEILRHIRAIDPQPDFQHKLLRNVTQMVCARPATASAREVLQDTIEGLQLNGPPDAIEQARLFDTCLSAWTTWEASHGHVLRNYVINSLQSKLLASHFGNPKALEDAYLDLVIRAALIRFWLVGQMAKYGEAFGQKHAVKTISSLSRNVEHDSKFMPRVLELMAQAGIRNLATGVVLLR